MSRPGSEGAVAYVYENVTRTYAYTKVLRQRQTYTYTSEDRLQRAQDRTLAFDRRSTS